MTSFFSSLIGNRNASFGYKITDVNGVPADLENIKGNIMKTSKKYREELSKYREIAKFNQQLSNGYIRNLEAMVDVSRVLNYYIEIFNVLRDEFEKNEKLLGSSLKVEDISYLERLTKNKIQQLNDTFMSESDKLKKLYNQYGKEAEYGRVNAAQQELKTTTESADIAFNNIKSYQNVNAETPSYQGGKKITRKVSTAAKSVKAAKAAKSTKSVKSAATHKNKHI
jgi:hypothetical protein